MKFKLLLIIVLFCSFCFSQSNEKISTIETVKILNNNKVEALYYFQNNWKKLRIKAVEKGYIASYNLLETTYSESTPFHILLITTYSNLEAYNNREYNFAELIKESGGLKLLNDKKPNEFRASVFGIDFAKHLE